MSLTEEDKQWITELLEQKLDRATDHLTERMRDMQTELLRGFGAHVDKKLEG